MSNRDRNTNRGQNRNDQDRWSDQGQNRQDDDWAQQVPWERGRGPYRDYGWERGESVLPEFRDSSVHEMDYDRQGNQNWQQQGSRQRGQQNQSWQKQGRMPQGPFSGVGPKNYKRSDERIMEDVCERLTDDSQIDARNIQINVKDGEVTLDGMVDSRMTKRRAEDVVDGINGVKDIHNHLKVQQQSQMQGSYNSGRLGGGAGRVDEVGGSGVYPASGPMPGNNAPVQGEASWGQGDRGAAGYNDSGRSEINPTNQTDQGNQRQQRKGK